MHPFFSSPSSNSPVRQAVPLHVQEAQGHLPHVLPGLGLRHALRPPPDEGLCVFVYRVCLWRDGGFSSASRRWGGWVGLHLLG